MQDTKNIFEDGGLFDGRYRLIKLLSADGGSADVWLALDINTIDAGGDESMATKVVIKIYRPKNILDIEGEMQFRSEFRTVFGCHHENIIQPTYFSIFNEMPYLVLPYCPAGSSESLVGKLTNTDDIWKYILEVASGLAYLHEHNPMIVHQDIKPANVLIDGNGNYAITDFGISVDMGGFDIHTDDATGGTLDYMAPERFVDDATPMPESDIWAFGATVYELITGKMPFEVDGGRSQSKDTPIPPINQDIPDEIKNIVYSCLAYDSAARPTARQIVDTVMKKRYGRRNRWFIGTIVAVVLAAAAILFFLLQKDPVVENVKGTWLLSTSNATEWVTYTFDDAMVAKSTNFIKGKIIEGRGAYFINEDKKGLTGLITNQDFGLKQSLDCRFTDADNYQIDIEEIDHKNNEVLARASLYKVVGQIEIHLNESVTPIYKDYTGTNRNHKFHSLNEDMVEVNKKTGELTGLSRGITFVVFNTPAGKAAIKVTVSGETLEDYILGHWLMYFDSELWEVDDFQYGGIVSSFLLTTDTIISTHGTYTVNEKENAIYQKNELDGIIMDGKLVLKSRNKYDFLDDLYVPETHFVASNYLRRVVDTRTIKRGSSYTPDYATLLPDVEISGYSTLDKVVATVDGNGTIKAVSAGHGFIAIDTDKGSAAIHLIVE